MYTKKSFNQVNVSNCRHHHTLKFHFEKFVVQNGPTPQADKNICAIDFLKEKHIVHTERMNKNK